MAPFLTIITRHHPGRPTMLAANIASLGAQTCKDFEHLIFVDHANRGMEGAQRWLMELIPRAQGRFVLVLDDDDVMHNPSGVEILKALETPETVGILCKGNCDIGGVLPPSPAEVITAGPVCGQLAVFNYALRRDIYCRSLEAYASGVYESDYLCITDVWKRAKEEGLLEHFASTEEVLCRLQRIALRGGSEPGAPMVFR